MTLAPSEYDHTDLRPAITRKGLQTFHLAAADSTVDLGYVAGCTLTADDRDVQAMTERGALRRGLNLCGKCAALEAAESDPDYFEVDK